MKRGLGGLAAEGGAATVLEVVEEDDEDGSPVGGMNPASTCPARMGCIPGGGCIIIIFASIDAPSSDEGNACEGFHVRPTAGGAAAEAAASSVLLLLLAFGGADARIDAP